jgi:L-fuconolactonase
MIIDTHLHIWELERFEYTWLNADAGILHQNYSIDTALEQLKNNRISGAILVEAHNSLKEAHWLLEIANAHPEILGVVAWCDLTSATLEQDLEPMLHNKKLKGVRPSLPTTNASDAQWQAMQHGLEILVKHNLTCDVLIPDRLSLKLHQMISAQPQVSFILNHFANAIFSPENHASWAASLECFAKLEHVSLKVSGFLTAAKHKPLEQKNLDLYFKTALELFGADRMMFGSDYPVCTLAGTYHGTLLRLEPYVCNAILHSTAQCIYKL